MKIINFSQIVFCMMLINSQTFAKAGAETLTGTTVGVSFSTITETVSKIDKLPQLGFMIHYDGGTIIVTNADLFNRGSQIDVRTLHSAGSKVYVCKSGTDACVPQVGQ